MTEQTVNFTLQGTDRGAIRKELIEKFLEEVPGTGKGENASRYRYNVETFGGYTVFLKRPAQRNKGMDFTVNFDRFFFKKKKRYSSPRHDDIINALMYCKSHYNNYQLVTDHIKHLYACQPVDLSNVSGMCFHDFEGKQHPIEVILLALKWLFIEQDCAYWNYSGRAMLYGELHAAGLV